MTSKEALQDLFTISNKITKDKLNLDTKEIFERYKVIREDLEMLEILKRIVKIVDCSKYPITSLDNQLVILSGGEIKNVKDYDKIKEWLENANR